MNSQLDQKFKPFKMEVQLASRSFGLKKNPQSEEQSAPHIYIKKLDKKREILGVVLSLLYW